MKSLFASPPRCVEYSENSNEDLINDEEIIEKFSMLNGIKLPKNKIQWEQANLFFKNNLPHGVEITNVEESIINLQNVLYDYFKNNFGTVNKSDTAKLFKKYEHLSNRQLKKSLKEEKNKTPRQVVEIKFISKLLRNKMCEKECFDTKVDHQTRINANFWKYCKETLDKKSRPSPEFDEQTCFDYFRKKVKARNESKSFDLPPWMGKLKKVTKVIRYMRSAASPCPADQISVIVLKNCPIIRTALWKIISHCWTAKYFPRVWKNGVTVLAYKKGELNNPENFRPITLQPVMSKVFTSLIKDRIYKYICSNNYIDQNIQKGFWTNVSGTIEHTETLTHLINNARNKQRNLVISLIDLRNSFGETLQYHHLPQHMVELVNSLYKDYQISVTTTTFTTHLVTIGRGVLQGVHSICVSIR